MGVGRRIAGVILLTLCTVGCAAHSARPEPFPRPGEPSASASPPVLSVGPAIVRAALELRGRPYGPGGSGPDRFDCSGLVQFVFARSDLALPRTVSQQFVATSPIGDRDPSAGDLLFFRMYGDAPTHVGIAMGDGRFVHAPSSRGVVRVESLSAPYWRERFAGARRVTMITGESR